jgi:hypothetical protein
MRCSSLPSEVNMTQLVTPAEGDSRAKGSVATMRPMSGRALPWLLMAMSACSTRQVVGLELIIQKGRATSTCVRVLVESNLPPMRGGPGFFGANDTVVAGILRLEAQEADIVVTVIGGTGPGCDESSPAERVTETLRFPESGSTSVTLALIPPSGAPDGGARDDDGDGSPAGVDCDDTDNRRAPMLTELCLGSVDEDCDGKVDCEDSDCNLLPCSDAGVCVQSMCSPTTCPNRVCRQSQNPCLASTGRCIAPNGDCTYEALADGTACDDGNTCTPVSTCKGGRCLDVSLTCPVAECQMGVGTCLSDGGCSATNRIAGERCSTGYCDGRGACLPFPFVPSNVVPSSFAADIGMPLVVSCPVVVTIAANGALTASGSSFGCQPPPLPSRVISQGPMNPPAVVISAPSIRITPAGSLTFLGSEHAVILFAWGDVTVEGTIDVSAREVAMVPVSGPGGSPFDCSSTAGDGRSPPQGSPQTLGGGGGQGGSFVTAGGVGGDGTAALNSGGRGLLPVGGPNLIPLRGGCEGARGGGMPGAPGGGGGGALQMTCGGTLTVTGTILSAGGGGRGARADNNQLDGPGGGGGGAGGAILLEAQQVHVTGRLAANGGSGGEGESTTGLGASGLAGRVGVEQTPNGGGISCGGNGGLGGARMGPATNGLPAEGVAPCGGGGGGGSAGRIRINAPRGCTGVTQVVSPRADSLAPSCQL